MASTRLHGARLVIVALGIVSSACSKDGAAPGADSGAGGAGTSGGGAPSSGGASNGGSGATGGVATGGVAGTSSASGGANSAGAGGTTSAGGATTGGATSAGGAASDAGTTDAGGGVDPCATALFCENFDSYATGKPPAGGWKSSTNMGTVNVVDTEHYSGGKSVECTTQARADSKTAYIKLDLASVFPVKGNAFFGRMMTRLESAPDTSVHWTFVQSSGLIAGQNYHSSYRYGGQLPVKNGDTFVGTQLMANYETPDNYSGTGPASDCWNHADAVVMPVAKWTCVEWQFDGPNDALRFWLDGKAIDSLTVQGTGQGCVHQDKTYEWKAPTFGDLELGWESYQMDTARTLYVDDVVVSTTRVGCPAAKP